MFAKTLELAQSAASSRALYTRFVLVALGVCVVLKTAWFYRLGMWENRILVDFDVFYIAAQRVWLGDLDQVYDFAKSMQMELEVTRGVFKFLPWTYPPQFGLLLAPFALFPLGIAYFLFTAGTLVFYLVTLRLIAGSYFALTLLLLLPVLFITIACGQNGFLTGGLIGLACLTLQRRQLVAGLALGMMVIKPHLAVALAVYSLVTRRWITVLAAGATVVATSALSTILFGTGIWSAFLGGVQQSGIYLERGLYPLFRMVSPYAGLRTMGAQSSVAFLAQAVVAICCLAIIVIAVHRGFAPRRSLGLAAIVSVLISPYALDYDLPIFGVGLALLLPDIVRLASERERSAVYALILLTGFYGLLQSFRLEFQFGLDIDLNQHKAFSIGGITLVVLLGLVFRILLRNDSRDETATEATAGSAGHLQNACRTRPAC